MRDPSLKYNLWIAGTALVVIVACAAVIGEEKGPDDTAVPNGLASKSLPKVNDPSLIGHLQHNVAGSLPQNLPSG